jgi:hypothetical protein
VSSNYVVWNPSVETTSPPALRAFVTLAQAAQIGEGTAAFVGECLTAAGVELRGAIVRWELQRYRTTYFTEYPGDEEAWEDRWQPAWRIHAELAEPPVLRGDSIDGQYPCDAEDASWTDAARPKAEAARCLLLVDFATEAALEEARAMVAEWVVGTRAGIAMGTFRQLELDLGDRDRSFYDGGDGLARDIVEMCRELGGHAHYQESIHAKLARA